MERKSYFSNYRRMTLNIMSVIIAPKLVIRSVNVQNEYKLSQRMYLSVDCVEMSTHMQTIVITKHD
jgi:hypothetical protein